MSSRVDSGGWLHSPEWREFPARVKCATLAWHTLHNAIEGEESTVTTE